MIGYVTLGTNDLDRAADFTMPCWQSSGRHGLWTRRDSLHGLSTRRHRHYRSLLHTMVSRRLRATGQWLRWQRTRRLQSMRCIAKPSSWAEHAKDHQAREETRFMPAISVILKETSSMYSA